MGLLCLVFFNDIIHLYTHFLMLKHFFWIKEVVLCYYQPSLIPGWTATWKEEHWPSYQNMTLTWLYDLDLIIWPWPLAFQESAKVWTRTGIESAQGSKRPTTNAVRWNIRTTGKQGRHWLCRSCPARTCPAPCPRGQGSRVSRGLPPHTRRSGSRLRSLQVDSVGGADQQCQCDIIARNGRFRGWDKEKGVTSWYLK